MISTKVARTILKDAKFPGEDDPTYIYCLSKTKRKNAVSSGCEHSNIAAAIQVQRFWRGYRTRCKLRAIFGLPEVSSLNVGGAISTEPSCDSIGKKKSLGRLYPTVKTRYKEYIHWCRDQGLDLQSSAVLSFEDYCARIIQSWWRRLDDRNLTGIECRAPSRVTDVGESESRPELDAFTAAVIIQRIWRRHNDLKVFRFYRDLINFRGKGNPKLMLQCINPAEARLLDRATGAHVKFRLGGDKFPPNIYYKVFTRRPIVDLCACSPRDYTAMSYRKKLPRDLHNQRKKSGSPYDDRENWYKRHENNGWRLVSDRFFLSKLQDPVTIETSSRQTEFHYSKLKRREALEKKRKQRKIEWLRKMYREGMLQAHKDLSSATTSAVHLAADQLVELSETHGPDVVEDEDVDELLSWTNALNFDEYVTDWHMSASTGFSDDCSTHLTEDDPYEVHVTVTTPS